MNRVSTAGGTVVGTGVSAQPMTGDAMSGDAIGVRAGCVSAGEQFCPLITADRLRERIC